MDLDRPSRPGQSGLPGFAAKPYAPPSDLFDPLGGDWVDPDDERRRQRSRYRRLGLGFSTLALALILASLSSIGGLLLIFTRPHINIGAILGIDRWEMILESSIVWISTIGVALLWGRWPDASWTRRSGLLFLMCLVDVVLWSLDHSKDLGLTDAQVGHDWFRRSVGQALGWSEFALIASLAAEMATRLGEPQAADFGRAARSMATTGAMVWFMWFYFQTDWNGRLWPLRMRRLDPGSSLLLLATYILSAISLVQVSILSLVASRCCGKALRQMVAEDRLRDEFPTYP